MPILMLTARGEVTDRVVGLELGADDYLAKPFEPRELVARIHNILKRSCRTGDLSDVLSYSDLRVDRRKQEVRIRNELVVLTTREFQLLELLAASPGVKFSRDQIIAALRGTDAELFSRAVDISISRLRNKLKPTQHIKTVWGLGYMFVE
jgi:OmpR family response regulator RpaB